MSEKQEVSMEDLKKRMNLLRETRAKLLLEKQSIDAKLSEMDIRIGIVERKLVNYVAEAEEEDLQKRPPAASPFP